MYEKETQMYRTDFWTLWEKARVGCFKRTASKHVYYLGWNGSPAQVGCMRQAHRPGALGRPRGIRWRGRWEGGSGWGIHVNLSLIHVNVWQKPLQYCKEISLQLIKINEKKLYMYTFFFILFSTKVFYRILSIILCYTEGPYLSILCIHSNVSFICWPQTPNPSLPYPPSPLMISSLLPISVSLFLFCGKVL